MEMKIYAYYGQLSHEKEAVYSPYLTKEDIVDEITVEMPHEIWYNWADDPGVTLGGADYLLREVLGSWNGAPALRWFDGHSNHHEVLKVVERKPATWKEE